MLSTTWLHISNPHLMKKIINIICSSAPQPQSLSVYSLLNCVLSSRTPTPLHVLCPPLPLAPLGPSAAELCIFCEGADKQNRSCKQSLFRRCAVSGKSVRVTYTPLAYTPQTPSIKKKKNFLSTADVLVVFQ